MKEHVSISLDFAGSLDENLLITSIHEEREDGESYSSFVKWPFKKNGSSDFDIWFKDFDTDTPPVEIGKKLYTLLFSTEFKAKLSEILNRANSKKEVLFKIKTNDNPLLSRIPFEILHDGRYFLFSNNKVFIRYVNDKTSIYPCEKPTKRILIILAEPKQSKYQSWGRDDFSREIKKELGTLGCNYDIIDNATYENVRDKIAQANESSNQYFSIFVVAHGEPAVNYSDGYLIFENSKGGVSKISGSTFCALISELEGCFVFLCSCSSGIVVPSNPLASVGHHIIFNGQAGSVLAMQRPVTVDFGLALIKATIESLNKGKNIFQAYKESLNLYLSSAEHGVPCLYSRPMKTKKQDNPLAESSFYKELNRIKSVFSIDIKSSKIALIFPGLIMGIKAEDYPRALEESWINVPQDQYKYRGLTAAKTDIGAGKGIIALLGKIFKTDELDERVVIETSDSFSQLLKDDAFTHYIFFGSYSYSFSREVFLSQYSKDFEFNYSEEFWTFIDKREGKEYKVPNPSKDENAKYKGDDYAIIEKIIDSKSGKLIFVIAGMRDTSTLAAGNYLISHIDDIYKKYGNGGFQILLSVTAGEKRYKSVVIERSPLISKL